MNANFDDVKPKHPPFTHGIFYSSISPGTRELFTCSRFLGGKCETIWKSSLTSGN